MTTLGRRTFRVTFDVTVSWRDIDQALVDEEHHHYANGEHIAQWPETPDNVRRDRRLLFAVLQNPLALRRLLLRHVAESLEYIHPDDASIMDLLADAGDAADLLAEIQHHLLSDDYQYYQHAAQAGYFYENTTYFEAAITTAQTNFRVQEISDTTA